MNLLLFLILVVVLSLLLAIGIISLSRDETPTPNWLPFAQLILAIMAMIIIGHFLTRTTRKDTEQETYKEALIENPYEMKILYDVRQDSIIPYDTIFIKK